MEPVKEPQEISSIFELLVPESRLTCAVQDPSPARELKVHLVNQKSMSLKATQERVQKNFMGHSRNYIASKPDTVNPLAMPKALVPRCGVCRKPARFRCSKCEAAHYCSMEHLNRDPMHTRICDRLVFIHKPEQWFYCSEERARHRLQRTIIKQSLVEELTVYGVELTYQEKFKDASNSLNEALIFIRDVYGALSVQQATLYLLIFEAELNQKRMDSAQKALASASETVISLQLDDPMLCTHSMLHKAYGLLCLHGKNLEEAQYHFAETLYYMAEQYGPRNVHCCLGYYYLGKVFLLQSKFETAASVFSFFIDLWLEFLSDHLYEVTREEDVPIQAHLPGDKSKVRVPKHFSVEGFKTLADVIKTLYLPILYSSIPLGKAKICLSILNFDSERFHYALDLKMEASMLLVESSDPELKNLLKRLTRLIERALYLPGSFAEVADSVTEKDSASLSSYRSY